MLTYIKDGKRNTEITAQWTGHALDLSLEVFLECSDLEMANQLQPNDPKNHLTAFNIAASKAAPAAAAAATAPADEVASTPRVRYLQPSLRWLVDQMRACMPPLSIGDVGVDPSLVMPRRWRVHLVVPCGRQLY